MKNLRFFGLFAMALLIASPLFFTSCKADETPVTPVVTAKDSTSVMVFHGCINAPTVKVLADNKVFSDSISYTKGTSYKKLEAGKRVFSTQTLTGTTVTNDTISFNKDVNYSLFVYRDSLGGVKVLTASDNLVTPASGFASIRVVHLIPDISNIPIDIEAVAPNGVAGSGLTLYTGVKFKDVKAFLTVPAQTYDIKIKQSSNGNVLFTVSSSVLAPGKIYSFVARGLALSGIAPGVSTITHN
jgi:hypothetical protein